MPVDESQLVPYGPDFTPSTLGKEIGEDNVLAWLLQQVDECRDKASLREAIIANCLRHIKTKKNKRDMASHVVQALGNYGLMVAGADNTIMRSAVGVTVAEAHPNDRDRVFARHILSKCNGLRLVELVKSYELRGETPTLEDLARVMDRNPTSKNISTMKAWLERVGVFKDRRYLIDYSALDELLGTDVAALYGLSEAQLEFVIAARILERQRGKKTLVATDVADVAEERSPGITIIRKSLGGFAKKLEERGILVAGHESGKGGRGTTVKLKVRGSQLADDELRALLLQSQAGFPVSRLRPMRELLAALAKGTAHQRGHAGEQLAVHVCLMLGLAVTSWRKRAPHTEVDLIAERTASLGYQRWMIQVKNTASDLDNDRVDRELGAAAGLGVTHVLFVVPRASATRTAVAEMVVKSRITGLHIYAVTGDAFEQGCESALILEQLREQVHRVAHAKRDEARRREEI